MKKGQIRIIGGQWRSRKIQVIDQPDLRPSTDRIRETVFNWLAGITRDARCLDLFAGSGILGFEALSRGAGYVEAIECSGATIEQLRKNADHLNTGDVFNLVEGDALKYLASPPKTPFDIVFIDPPYALNLQQTCLDRLCEGGWLSEQALVYVECDSRVALTLSEHWLVHRVKVAGQVCFYLLKRGPE